MALLNAFVQTPDDEVVFFGGILVPGAQAEVVLDSVLSVVLEEGGPTVSEAELGGLPVTVIVEDGLAASTTYVHPAEDILWLVVGPEDVAIEALSHLSS